MARTSQETLLPTTPAPDRSQAHIVLADVPSETRTLVSSALQDATYNVETIDSLDVLFDTADSTTPDLLIIGNGLPGESVCDAYAALKKHPAYAWTPILLLVDGNDTASVEAAHAAGFRDFLVLPAEPQILVYRVESILEAHDTLYVLQEHQQRLAAAQRIARLGHWELELAHKTLQVSEAARAILGLSPAHQGDLHLSDMVNAIHPQDRMAVSRAIFHLGQHRTAFSLEARLSSPKNVRRVIQLDAEAEKVPNRLGVVRILGTVQDISERKRAEDELYNLAHFDPLTGLPNRRSLQEHLGQVLAQARLYERLVAILSIDIDLFKRINETLGHRAGDMLIKDLAERLQSSLRHSDIVLRRSAGRINVPFLAENSLARLTDDEFVVVLPQIRRSEDASSVAQRIQQALEQPFEVDDQQVFLTASIGIIVYPHDGEDVDTLLSRADAAMRQAKHKGRSRFQYFARSVNDEARDRLRLEADFRRALDNDALEVYYQPKVNIQTQQIVGMEALSRWTHPQRGPISPGVFIAIAEETGLIIPLGEWVLRKACKHTAVWRKQGLMPLKVAVNVSARQINETDFSDVVRHVLSETGLPAKNLQLEITEGLLVEQAEMSGNVLQSLRDMQLSLALDDFGTGYSSLTYLKRFPVDTLKIDQSFVRDIPANTDSTAIAAAIVALADSLGLNVVAEGVETREQLEFLRAQGCQEVQGYFFSRPIPAKAFEAFCRQYLGGIKDKDFDDEAG